MNDGEQPFRILIADSVKRYRPTHEFNVTSTATPGDQRQIAQHIQRDSATQTYMMIPQVEWETIQNTIKRMQS